MNENVIEVNLSCSVIGNSNDETNFLHGLVLTNTQVSRLCKVFAKNSSGNVKLSKTQFQKIRQSGRFLGRYLRYLPKSSSPLMESVLKTNS